MNVEYVEERPRVEPGIKFDSVKLADGSKVYGGITPPGGTLNGKLYHASVLREMPYETLEDGATGHVVQSFHYKAETLDEAKAMIQGRLDAIEEALAA